MIHGLESDCGRYYKALLLELKGYYYTLRHKLWPIVYDPSTVETPRESGVPSLGHVRQFALKARDACVLAHIWTKDGRRQPGLQLGEPNYHPSGLSNTSGQRHASTSRGRRRYKCR